MLTFGVEVNGCGEIVIDGSENVGVSVISIVSVIVGVLVLVRVIVGVSEGVKVGGGSWVGVYVDFIWKGVLVEVPLMVYFSDT